MTAKSYPIGRPGLPWDQNEKQQWLALQQVKRSYTQDVVEVIKTPPRGFKVTQYGELSIDPETYPMFALEPLHFDSNKPTMLITGGVHGYETSGVKGALKFAFEYAHRYFERANIIVLPCISPWGYETINRWNPRALDPNRSFFPGSGAEESELAMQFVKPFCSSIRMHIDLHETTDTDNTEFRPALAARDAVEQKGWHIPDGFYLVGDTQNPQIQFQQTIIDAVRDVTHIAPADENGSIIGAPLLSEGVISYDKKALFLCAGMTDADYVTTTEVYPDSLRTNEDECNDAQVAAVNAAIKFVLDA